MNKYILILNTAKHLKFIQIYYRLFYFVRKKFRNSIGFKYNFSKESKATLLKLADSIESCSLHNNGKFNILNLYKEFDSKVDWNYSKFGKLWTYNLTYFEYLKEKVDISLIHSFINNLSTIRDGIEPFPISLRGINWIKFLNKHQIKDKQVNDSLYAQYYVLLDNLEYHLLGNHLLENGFSLMYGSYYFQDNILYNKAKEIITRELNEQILDDGAHFELSPMYHQIILFKLLDCINLVKNNNWKNQELLKYLEKKASIMLGWLKTITYKNGDIPLLNDSTKKIAPASNELFNYALSLNQLAEFKNFNQSGYRKIEKENYECIIDIGEIGASYIPGHAHADTFNFELYIKNKPFIVDTGLSTYNIGELRNNERSTKAHNTVEINSEDSSQVWDGFRVANRAKIIGLVEKENYIKATHDGYNKKFGILHTRSWKFEENKIIIDDSLNKGGEAIARLHFHPNTSEVMIRSKVNLNMLKYKIEKYNYSQEFNKTIEALALEIPFENNLRVEINI